MPGRRRSTNETSLTIMVIVSPYKEGARNNLLPHAANYSRAHGKNMPELGISPLPTYWHWEATLVAPLLQSSARSCGSSVFPTLTHSPARTAQGHSRDTSVRLGHTRRASPRYHPGSCMTRHENARSKMKDPSTTREYHLGGSTPKERRTERSTENEYENEIDLSVSVTANLDTLLFPTFYSSFALILLPAKGDTFPPPHRRRYLQLQLRRRRRRGGGESLTRRRLSARAQAHPAPAFFARRSWDSARHAEPLRGRDPAFANASQWGLSVRGARKLLEI